MAMQRPQASIIVLILGIATVALIAGWPGLEETAPAENEPEPARASAPPKPTAPRVRQPDYATGQHIIVGFRDSSLGTLQKRSADDARRLAKELVDRADSGEDMTELVAKYSDDPSRSVTKGLRVVRNHGVIPSKERPAASRSTNRAYGDMLFSLEIGEVGVVQYDPGRNDLGFLVIKRVK